MICPRFFFSAATVHQPRLSHRQLSRPYGSRPADSALGTDAARFCSRLLLVALIAGLPALPVSANSGEKGHLFADTWELTDLSSWGDIVGGPTPAFPEAYRFVDMDVRDPHFFPSILSVGCPDLTDQGVIILGGLPIPSVNETLEDRTLNDRDLDGCLDLSNVFLFRPLDQQAVGLRMDNRVGRCTAPLATTSCTAMTAVPGLRLSYDGFASGSCLEALGGTTSGYTPGIDVPSGPCFVTAPQDAALTIYPGLEVPLQDVQYAASFAATEARGPGGAGALVSGLIRGFLTEAEADQAFIPDDVPVIKGQPVSALLPGGTNSCAAGDDRDIHRGQSGWWFYLNFRAEQVSWMGL
jgi:hypothetical protein